MIIAWIYFIIAILITVAFHESGHAVSALLLKVKVKAFSIGFGRPYLHKKFFGIDFRLSPILLGGYTQLEGEDSKVKGGFLAQRYYKKVIILISGVFINLLIAMICYWINYKSIILGIKIDYLLIKSVLIKDIATIESIMILLVNYNINFFLLQLSLINIFCAVFNLLPVPALDGGFLFIVWLEKIFDQKRFIKILKALCFWGMIILVVLQLLFILIFWR